MLTPVNNRILGVRFSWWGRGCSTWRMSRKVEKELVERVEDFVDSRVAALNLVGRDV